MAATSPAVRLSFSLTAVPAFLSPSENSALNVDGFASLKAIPGTFTSTVEWTYPPYKPPA